MDIDIDSLRLGNINQLRVGHGVNTTCGEFTSEEQAQRWFIDFATKTSMFYVYEQISGSRIFKHHLQSEQDRFIADVILLPVDDRISLGALAVEIKRSGEKIGPGISQLKDYLSCTFRVGKSNVAVMPTYGFLFPCPKQNSATASWMQHQHLGTIDFNNFKSTVAFYSGEERLLEFQHDGQLVFSTNAKSGKKSGSR